MEYYVSLLSQSAFAGYGLEELALKSQPTWQGLSQSAFAGYGLEEREHRKRKSRIGQSQSAFAGYGLEELAGTTATTSTVLGRNPLSLDMGWKRVDADKSDLSGNMSQSAFAGYGLERQVFRLIPVFQTAMSQNLLRTFK